MPSLNVGRKAVVGGLSAAVAATALYAWYRKRNAGRRKSSFTESPSFEAPEEPEPLNQSQTEESEEEATGMSSSFVKRGGRRNYRAEKNSPSAAAESSADAPVEAAGTKVTCQGIFESAPLPPTSWAAEMERDAQLEANAVALAAEFGSKCSTGPVSVDTSCLPPVHPPCTEEEVRMVMAAASPVLVGQTVESPSLASDHHSEASQDSGKGASTGLASSMSPVEELIEAPPCYEFEIPKDIVGLIIGKKGTTIKYFTEQSGCHIVIRDHFLTDSKCKICTLEGSREEINKCLRLIRRKFPPSRFPELKLTPLMPPLPPSPVAPAWEMVIQLNLPEAVACEVVLTSVVNPGHVFLQQPTHPTFPSLSRLDQYMLAVYSQPAGVPELPQPIEGGVVCAAPVLGGWYRAQTMATYAETDEVLVKFVDYGGYCKLPAADLKQIRSDFMTLPFQACECYLAHVKPAGDKEEWSAEACAAFEDLGQGKVIEALVVGTADDGLPLVELFAPVGAEMIMINRYLAENGLAEWTDDGESEEGLVATARD